MHGTAIIKGSAFLSSEVCIYEHIYDLHVPSVPSSKVIIRLCVVT